MALMERHPGPHMEDTRMRRSLLTVQVASYDPQGVSEFMASRAASWRARPDVVRRATHAVRHVVENVMTTPEPPAAIHFVVSFDASNLDVTGRYRGTGTQLGECCELRATADRVNASGSGRTCVVSLHFDH